MTTWQDIGTEGRPVRIQRKRTKGWKMPPNTVSVCRPGPFGNPFPLDISGAADAVDRFRRWLTGNMSSRELSESSLYIPVEVSPVFVRKSMLNLLPRLRGKNLACWCPLVDKHGNYVPCHADALLSLANQMTCDEVRDENLRWAKRETA